MKIFKRALPFLIALIAVLLDQLTKYLAVVHLKPIGSVPLIEGIFHFTYTTNPGAAFSLFAAEDQRWIFMTVSSIAIVAMTAYLLLVKKQPLLLNAAVGAVMGGGIGNMIDRIFVGEVVDFLDFRLINFPIFNVADCFVCVGAALLFLAFILDWRREIREEAAKKATEENNDSAGA